MCIAPQLVVSPRTLLSSSPVSYLASSLRWWLSFVSFVSFVTFVSFVRPPSASAQPADAVGVRAQGMGGAFTALADDATATWWNPAGLAGGSYFNGVLEYGHLPNPNDGTVKGFAIAFPALGLSYYRLPISEM